LTIGSMKNLFLAKSNKTFYKTAGLNSEHKN
jgi:hypothetical protein